MGRKNKRKRSEYRDWLGFDPRKFVRYSVDHDRKICHAAITPVSVGMRMPKRGDVWFADLGIHPGTSVQAGCRLVLIMSNDIGNRYADTVNVLPMTRHLKRQGLPCHTQVDPEKVLDMRQPLEPSMVLAEQVTTVSKSVLRNYAGHISDDELMKQIDLAVRMQLGLWEDDAGSTMVDLSTGPNQQRMTLRQKRKERDYELESELCKHPAGVEEQRFLLCVENGETTRETDKGSL